MLEGRGGAEDWSPKKSSPRRESFVLVVLGGAGTPLEATLGAGGLVVLARAGMGSPPMRSIWGAGAGTGALGCDDWPMEAFRIDSFRSMVFFSFTRLRGMLSSSSRVDGSGMGPSMTQRFSSYLVRMKDSTLPSLGLWPAANLASQYLFARALPQLSTL